MLRVASGARGVPSGTSCAGPHGAHGGVVGWAARAASREPRNCGARLARGTRMGIPRWLSDDAAPDPSSDWTPLSAGFWSAVIAGQESVVSVSHGGPDITGRAAVGS